MKRSNTRALSDILKDFVDQNIDEEKLNEAKIVNSWESVMGKTVSRYTKRIFIQDKKLLVELKSPVLKNELHYMKQAILEKLNQKTGNKNTIKEVVFI